jgi:predicted CoA-binding protein
MKAQDKATLVIGVSNTKSRYANMAVDMLKENNYPVLAIGKNSFNYNGIHVNQNLKGMSNVHTVSLYLRAENHEKYLSDIIELRPKRLIFNPGTESRETKKMLEENDIECIDACTLVLLRTNQY